jgi:hypothetical protein
LTVECKSREPHDLIDLWALQAVSFKASGVREGGAIPPLPRNCKR